MFDVNQPPRTPQQRPRPPRTTDVVEYLVYRYREVTKTGLKRDFVINVVPGSDMNKVLWNAGVGRYRVEARDRKRQVRKVALFEVLTDGRVVRARPFPKKRKLPPPQYVV